MKISGLNHITLSVTNLAQSIEFYCQQLGFTLKASWSDGAYLEAGTLWLCLARQDDKIEQDANDYSHVALSIDKESFDNCADKLLQSARIWKTNTSEGQSLYFLDPDGHRLEIHVGDLKSRLDHYRLTKRHDITIY